MKCEKSKALVVITGDGKGKTSAAVGMAIRAVGAGVRVALIAFDKGVPKGDNEAFYSERVALRRFPEIEVFSFGRSRMNADALFCFKNLPEDLEQARLAVDKAKEVVQIGAYGMVICDEILSCVSVGLLQKSEIGELIDVYNATGRCCDLVLTGRGGRYDDLVDEADIVSDIHCIKHHYDKGVQIRRGLDY